MIAFNYNIHFQDEPTLDDGIYDANKENIYIIKSTNTETLQKLTFKSEYLPLSGREASYGAEKVYALCKKGCQWGVDVKGLMSFLWCGDEQKIYYAPQENYSTELLQFWILHTILPTFFSLDNTYNILHVGAVEVKEKPILFSAESFGGKSTMTDYFLKQGHTLISDDTVGVYEDNGTFKVVASYPFHRPYREAESLGFKVTKVMHDPKPIHAVYLLEKSDADAKVVIEEVKGIAKYRAFHFSTFINFDFLKEQHFKILSTMANKIPVYKVTVPWDLKRLPEVYEKILEHTVLV